MDKLKELPVWLLILIPVILLSQGTWLFMDAKKRSKLPWFWGIWGLIQAPLPLLFYWLFIRSNWLKNERRQ